jgi:uncharacterized protein YcnI
MSIRQVTAWVCAAMAISSAASAHVSVNSPAFATKSAMLTFNVGHGCEGLDTVSIDVTIPPEITALRAMPTPWFGDTQIVKDESDVITNVIWTKTDFHDTDDLFYQMSIRTTMPDLPFTTLYFPVTQTCMGPDGKTGMTDWAALPGDPKLADGSEAPPAPAVTILPPRSPGWNKFTVPVAVDNLAMFNDAQIVWDGDAAYSSNPVTMDLIKGEDGVSVLEAIAEGDEIWVKY